MRADSKGTSHLYSRPFTAYTTGVKGNAARFVPSSGNYLIAADTAAISAGDIDFTLRAHVYLNNVTTTTILAMKGEKDNMNRRDFTLFVDGSSGKIGFRVGNGTISGYVLSGTVTTGRWYTVTAWYNAAANNQTTRTINGMTLTLAYDAEGHLVSVSGRGISASFTYDGDGARVKSTINGTATYFVGNH